ncbi:MAG: hypothetical protein DHS20C20_10830 [Ardenticatenaceae bacterium]|nr:MAG: hypothetical protein DHS20C20_10830 [Ardenticatenaceae bacterium]
MKLKEILLSALLLLLIGCTAVTVETPTDEPAETAVPSETAVPQEQPVNNENSETEPVEQADPTPEMEPTATEEGKQVSEPVTVNLGDVTPVPMNETPVVQPAPGNPGIKEPVAQAMADLSQRLSVSVDDIEMVSLQEVTWRDGSLGCPEPGVAYTQALVDGQQLVLQVAGIEYHYHSGRGGDFIYCSNPVPPLDNATTNPNPLQPIPGQDD